MIEIEKPRITCLDDIEDVLRKEKGYATKEKRT